jgi:hypothetical protein
MDVVEMAAEVLIVANGVLPVAALPDIALALSGAAG